MGLSITASDVKDRTLEIAKNFGNKGLDAARWCGHQVSKIGSSAKAGFFRVIEFARNFFKNIPTYARNAGTYLKDGIGYIKANKTPVGVGAGLTFAVGAIIYGLYTYINRAPGIA